MNELKILFVALALCLSSSFLLANNPGNNFRVSVNNAELSEFSKSCLKLESQSRNYSVKLVPNSEGAITFSLGKHAFRSTYKAKNLYFGVRIQGYKDGEVFLPSFNVDDSYQDVFIDGNFLIFKHIDHPIPVLFEGGADSIKLSFSNSHNFNFHQYLSLNELQVLEKAETKVNPVLVDCENHSIMIAIQGSNAIDRAERKTISKELMGMFKNQDSSVDSNEVSILQFGKKADNISQSTEKKEIVSSIKEYKKAGKGSKSEMGYTNWGAALDEALEKKPDIFILVTNSWSNYGNQGASTINAQHADLVSKCNTIKENGTRLLFITSGLYDSEKSNMTLLSMLNEENTQKVLDNDLNQADLKEVDLISMDGFKRFKSLNLSTLIQCEQETVSQVVNEK